MNRVWEKRIVVDPNNASELLEQYIKRGTENRANAVTRNSLSVLQATEEKMFTGVENLTRGLKKTNDAIESLKQKVGR